MLRSLLLSLVGLVAVACAAPPEDAGGSAQAATTASRGLDDLAAAMNDYAPALHDTYVPHYVLTAAAQDASEALLRTEQVDACEPVTADDARAFLVEAAGEALPIGTDVEADYARALEQWVAPLTDGAVERCGYRRFVDTAYEGEQTDFVLFRVERQPAVMLATTVHWN